MNNNNKKTVLIVDDDSNMNMVLMDKLNLSGFNAESAMDGEEGLQKALKVHPDVILLDVIMPKMGGMEMLKKLRDDDWGKTAKVIMLTAIEDSDHVAQAVEKQSYRFLVKSQQSLDDVVKVVKEVLN